MTAQQSANVMLPDPPDGAPCWSLRVYSHTHWDREWYQPFERFRMQLVAAIDRVMDVLEADPSFSTYVLDGQAIVLDDYLEVRPEQHERLARLIGDGRIEVGPWYVLPDEFLVSGESLVRNLLEGRRVVRRLGEPLAVGYLPDPFGHVAQMPQLLRGFGIDSIIFSRGMGDEWDSLGSEFRWQALDGETSVIAIVQSSPETNGYCNGEWLVQLPDPADPRIEQRARALVAHLAAHARSSVLLVAAGSDHETVNPLLPTTVERLAAVLPGTQPRICGLRDVVDEVAASIARREEAGATIGVHQGELRGARHAPILAGILSSRLPLKQDNALVQGLLERCIEPLASLGLATGAFRVPESVLQHVWRLALQNHPHDSIGGCSIDETHEDMPNRSKRALDVMQGVLEDLQVAVGADTAPHVFNPEPRRGGALVRRWDGTPAWVESLPGLSLVPLEQVVASDAVHGVHVVDMRTIASDLLSVQASGDGRIRIELRAPGRAPVVLDDALAFIDVADAGDEYDFGALPGDRELRATLVDAMSTLVAPGVAELRVLHRIDLPVSLVESRSARSPEVVTTNLLTTLRIAGDQPWVACETVMDNPACDHRMRIRVPLPLGLHGTSTVADGQFAMVERPVVPAQPMVGWKQDPLVASCCESCAVLPASDGSAGVAILTRGMHEYEPCTMGGVATAIEVTMLRSVGWLSRDDVAGRPQHAGPELPTPAAQCIGPLRVEYAIAPFSGSWQAAGLAGIARRFARPAMVLEPIQPELRRHSGQQARERDLLAECGGVHVGALASTGIEVRGGELSALKPADDGSGDIILRVFNPLRTAVPVEVVWPPQLESAWQARLDELPGDEIASGSGHLHLDLAAGGIATVRLRPGSVSS